MEGIVPEDHRKVLPAGLDIVILFILPVSISFQVRTFSGESGQGDK